MTTPAIKAKTESTRIDFGTLDKKGRALGVLLRSINHTYADGSQKFYMTTARTRNGELFEPSATAHFPSEAARSAAAKTFVAAARRSAKIA